MIRENVLGEFAGKKVSDGVTYKKLTLLEKAENYITERRRTPVSSPGLKAGVSTD